MWAKINRCFEWAAKQATEWAGHASAFSLALVFVIGWLISGPFFGWSDTWQLVINTSTTIITFLMVFLIQSTQNRDTRDTRKLLEENNRRLAALEKELELWRP